MQTSRLLAAGCFAKPVSIRARRIAVSFRMAKRASVAIEFALILPVFLALLLEIFQFGMYFYISSQLDNATAKAARQIFIGTVGNQNLNVSQFLTQILCPQLGGLSCSSSIVVNLVDLPAASDSTGFMSLANAAQTRLIVPPMDHTSTTFCPGFTGGRDPTTGNDKVEVLEVFYPMPAFSLYWLNIAATINGSAYYYVRSMVAFQNEPYQVTGQSGGC